MVDLIAALFAAENPCAAELPSQQYQNCLVGAE